MQHPQKHSFQRIQELKQNFKRPQYSKCILGDSESESDAFQRMKEIYSRVLGWEVQKDEELVVGLVSNEVVSHLCQFLSYLIGLYHKILTKDYIPTAAEIGTSTSNFQYQARGYSKYDGLFL
jgi:hypothetical protein